MVHAAHVPKLYGHFYLASVKGAFYRAIEEFRPDLLFAPWAYPDGWAAVQLARKAQLAVVVQVHGSDLLLLDQFPARKTQTIRALQSADGIVAVSQDIASYIVRDDVPDTAIRVIYDGVDPKIFYPGSKDEARKRLQVTASEPLLLFIGNLVPVKAVDVLLEACNRLNRNGTSIQLNIIGQGSLRSSLEQRAAKLGMAQQVHFLGSMPQEKLADWYRASDLFVLPSHSEGVPNVLLESSACGTPYVASRVGGIPEITYDGNGRLVPPNTPDALAEAIREMLLNPIGSMPQARRIRQDAVAELEQFLGRYMRESIERLRNNPARSLAESVLHCGLGGLAMQC